MRGFLCKNHNGAITLSSVTANAPGKPDVRPLPKGASLIIGTLDNGLSLCVYEISFKVPAESKDLIYDLSVPRHMLVASGDVNNNGGILYHGQNRFATREMIDITKVLVCFLF